MKVIAKERPAFTLDINMAPREGEAIVVLTRVNDNGVQTLGNLVVYKDNEIIFRCETLELPWRDNKVGVSCVPTGAYNFKRYSSAKFTNVYALPGVPDRSYILVHSGNYYTDIEGCILVGEGYKDINADDEVDVVNSKDTLAKLKEALDYEEVPIIIQNS